jgi:hypothetical protein
MNRRAIMSEDTKYRYQLSRSWDETKRCILFIMLNPSTADDITDDPTIRRVINFSKSWGYGSVLIGNLYAYRSTDPKVLKTIENPIGEDNISHISQLIEISDKVVYAWGNNQKEPDWLTKLVEEPYCIDISKKGIPKHPLYLKGDMLPVLYSRPFYTRNHM